MGRRIGNKGQKIVTLLSAQLELKPITTQIGEGKKSQLKSLNGIDKGKRNG